MVLLSYVEVITSKVLRVDRHGISVPQMTKDMFHLSQALPGPFLVLDLSPGL
jgi:hypothetical protein